MCDNDFNIIIVFHIGGHKNFAANHHHLLHCTIINSVYLFLLGHLATQHACQVLIDPEAALALHHRHVLYPVVEAQCGALAGLLLASRADVEAHEGELLQGQGSRAVGPSAVFGVSIFTL